MTKIVSAALLFTLADDSDTTLIISGKRHAELYELLYELNIDYRRESVVEGFMTSTDRFVNRYEAKHIAVEACQLIVPIEETYPELYSEDVW